MVWKYTLSGSSADLAATQVMGIPPGAFTIEKTIPTKTPSGALDRAQSFAIGLRQHFLESSESSGVRSLKALHNAHVNHEGVDSTTSFWSKILDACAIPTGSNDKGKGKGKIASGNAAALAGVAPATAAASQGPAHRLKKAADARMARAAEKETYDAEAAAEKEAAEKADKETAAAKKAEAKAAAVAKKAEEAAEKEAANKAKEAAEK